VPNVLFTAPGPPAVFGGELVHGVAEDPILGTTQPGESAAQTAALWTKAIAVLASLHQITPMELGLTDEPVRSPASELSTWINTARSAGLDDTDAAIHLVKALERSVPFAAHTAVVHGDFRLGNIMVRENEPVALIDWEIWSIGDPAVDLGWLVQFTDAGNYPGLGRDVPGTPSASTVIEQYCCLRGDDPARFNWFVALGCLKLAAIQAHNLRRHRAGRHADPFQESLGPSIEILVRRGLELVASPSAALGLRRSLQA
jgi:aminoglycoside phosphotransferase (APT) family kinase protein